MINKKSIIALSVAGLAVIGITFFFTTNSSQQNQNKHQSIATNLEKKTTLGHVLKPEAVQMDKTFSKPAQVTTKTIVIEDNSIEAEERKKAKALLIASISREKVLSIFSDNEAMKVAATQMKKISSKADERSYPNATAEEIADPKKYAAYEKKRHDAKIAFFVPSPKRLANMHENLELAKEDGKFTNEQIEQAEHKLDRLEDLRERYIAYKANTGK